MLSLDSLEERLVYMIMKKCNKHIQTVSRFSHLRNSMAIALVFLFLMGCSNSAENLDPSVLDETVFEVNLSPQTVANSNLPGSIDLDSRMEEVAILVFDEDSKFLYRAQVVNIDYDEGKKLYSIKFKTYKSNKDERFDLVFLANFPIEGNLYHLKGKDKEQLLSDYNFSSIDASGNYKWVNGKVSLFPMWGELKSIHLNPANKVVETATLMRSISRFDFGFKYHLNESGQEVSEILTDEDSNEYALKSIHVYNAQEYGAIAPKNENLSSTAFAVVNPTLPKNPKKLDPIVIQLDNVTQEPISQKLFLLENTGGTLENNKDEITSFVFGLYNESFSNLVEDVETHVRYFRADLARDGVKEIESMLRNVRYMISLENIRGIGYTTPEEAYNRNVSVVLDFDILDWEVVDYEIPL